MEDELSPAQDTREAFVKAFKDSLGGIVNPDPYTSVYYDAEDN